MSEMHRFESAERPESAGQEPARQELGPNTADDPALDGAVEILEKILGGVGFQVEELTMSPPPHEEA